MKEALDPQIAALLQHLPPASDETQTQEQFVTSSRATVAMAKNFSIATENVARVDDRLIPGPAGALPVRIYTPATQPQGPLTWPVLIWLHGGGFVAGDLDASDAACRVFANRAQCVVVSVDYRLAPESPYPAANEDCWAAFLWVLRDAAEIHVDPARVGIGGESAGGLLTAWVAQKAAKSGYRLKLQLLVCSSLDASLSMPSWQEVGTGEYWLTTEWMRDALRAYLPGKVDLRSPEVSPLFAVDVSKVAPAIIVTATYDPLHDEGEAYARKLEAAGVPVSYINVPGMIHSPLALAGAADAGKALIDQLGNELREAFAARS